MTGIDPSHVDLQHLANDHSTTTLVVKVLTFL